jgi:hypothetical protein
MQMDLEARRTNRVLQLKARQLGATTYHVFRGFWNCLTRTDHHVLIIGQEERLPQELLAKIKLALKYMPEEFRPQLEYNTRFQMTFPDFRSSITIGTGRVQRKMSGAKLGRTYQELIMTEVADPAWEDDVIKMLLQTVPDDGIVVMDSTPKGRRGYFYDQWQAARHGDSEFAPLFYSWPWDDAYRAAPEEGFEFTDEERVLAASLDLTPEHIAWRRRKIVQIGPDTFREQYPENDIDCFLFSGSQFFSRTDLMHFLEMPEFCKGWPTWRGTLQTNPQTGRVDRIELPKGPLSIYAEPEKGHTYVVGADVADNVEKGDYSCAEVIDWKTCEQVAEWHGRIDPDLFGYVLADLGRYYNNAFMVVEANGPGNTTAMLLDHRLHYQPLFYRERQTGNVNYMKPGWLTTGGNRGPMMHGLAKHIREWSFKPHSESLVGELMTIVCDPLKRGSERYAAETGCHDDRVMAMGIALEARESAQCIPREREHLSSLAARRHEQVEREADGKSSYESWFMDGR